MIIRKYKTQDCSAIVDLFYETIHTINARDYSKKQLNAWTDRKKDLTEWDQSFLEHYTVVAEINNTIVGFGDIDKSGYLDRLFIHKNYQRQGIATSICDELEKNVSVERIITHASITAKPFFLQRGYCEFKEQQVFRKGIALTNYIMEKRIGKAGV